MHFVRRGFGRPVVLVHGNPGSCHDWTRVFSQLEVNYRAIAFDRPGHGHSIRPNQDLPVESQARLLNGALRQLRAERPILVGHSWGAALALAYALNHPDEIAGLVLLAPAIYESQDGLSFMSKIPSFPYIGRVVNLFLTPLFAPRVIKQDLEKAFAPDPVPRNYLKSVLSRWTRRDQIKWYSVDDNLLNPSLRELSPRYSEIKAPAVIVTGDSDQIVPPEENAHRLHQALPESELQVLPKTGHQILFTHPLAVVEAINTVAAKAA
jgi:pimeloyl-ACP methyl ester carboxylesterase